jgi:hypothetical protein
MSKKKKTKEILKNLARLEAGLEGLGDIGNDLTKARKNMQKFLSRTQKLLSGHPHQFRRK